MKKQQSPIQAYIEHATNRWSGGFTIPLPTTPKVLRPFLDGIDVTSSQDIFIMPVRANKTLLDKVLCDIIVARRTASPDTLNELNYLAVKMNSLNEEERETFTAALEVKRYCRSIADIINLTENLDCLFLQPAYSPIMYGEFLLATAQEDEFGCLERLKASANSDDKTLVQHIERLERSVDPLAYGRVAMKEENGTFTKQGYLVEVATFKSIY
ncbi:MAG: antirestriction protein ArdA [Oscillospiraceae bacterium]|nr:antirestriction protein ArdA [Oscillospiraceae bacterium]